MTLSALPATGCSDDGRYEPAEVTWIGEHIEYAPGLGVAACEGSLEWLDGLAGQIGEEVGAPEGEPIRYFHLNVDDLSEVPACGPTLAACALGGWVYTNLAVDAHEVVHAVRQTGSAPRDGALSYLEEGLASYYGYGDPARLPQKDRIAAVLDTGAERLAQDLYATAGHFVSLLVQRYGLAEVVDFIDGSADARTREQMAKYFEGAFDEPLDAVLTAYAEYPACGFERSRNAYECQLEPTPWTGSGREATLDIFVDELACSAPGVLGPNLTERGEEVWVYRTFEIDDRTVLEHNISVPAEFEDAAQGARVSIARCDDDCTAPVYIDESDNFYESRISGLPPGKYVARLSRRADDPGFAGFRIAIGTL